MKTGMYSKLIFSLLLSFCIMYGVMFLNVDDAAHIYLSLTRTYMSLLMVSPMAIVMVLVMQKMYPDKRKNIYICAAAASVFITALLLLRTQTPVSDVQYMKAMIPHHSSAILTSKHADLKDPEVKKLAEGIIASQEKEISEMKAILVRMNK